jgi:hypothetical protein
MTDSLQAASPLALHRLTQDLTALATDAEMTVLGQQSRTQIRLPDRSRHRHDRGRTRTRPPRGRVALDAHCDGLRPVPDQGPRPKTTVEHSSTTSARTPKPSWSGPRSIGQHPYGFGVGDLLARGAAHGEQALVAALHRAVAFRRFRAADVRSILAAGAATPLPRPAGDALILDLPIAPTRPLDAYTMTTVIDGGVSSWQPHLPWTLTRCTTSLPAVHGRSGLRRLKLAANRRTAPEVLLTAKSQHWTPEEVLRTLVETELAAGMPPIPSTGLRLPRSRSPRPLESFDVAASSIQPKVSVEA